MSTKILIVGESHGNAAKVEERLQAGEYVVETCDAGPKALAVAQGFSPDIIVVDVLDADGPALAAARTLGWVHRVPLVFVTGSSPDTLASRVRDIPMVTSILTRSRVLDGLEDAVESALCEVRSRA